ncbi:MAG: serine/threonine protein kinase [Chitinispirillaceae bacterium]|nr:serine/threonine protein kinase [Chitinispirillaceae bacterium]
MTFDLNPETILGSVERATGLPLTGLISPLPSYINRVYELRSTEGEKIIVKFYRPGRWNPTAINDEHTFLGELDKEELSVVPPRVLMNGTTLDTVNGTPFAVFPKKAGRQLEITTREDWIRLGTLVARMHTVGSKHSANDRLIMHPHHSTSADSDYLCQNVLPVQYRESYRSLVRELIDLSSPVFEQSERIRLHGDLHRGNMLDRMQEGLLLIDFDDMVMGPPVQDLWLLLPDRAVNSGTEIELFLEGYEQFRDFNRRTLACIEPLRAMRMIYFLAWCSRQIGDYQFRRNFPDWGTDAFWRKEINDLREQMGFVRESSGPAS